jgi:hypothetical protein
LQKRAAIRRSTTSAIFPFKKKRKEKMLSRFAFSFPNTKTQAYISFF